MRKLLVLLLAFLLLACGGGESFEKWTSSRVVDAFKDAGLDAENARPMTKDDYGMAPMVAAEGTRFLVLSLGEGAGGRVMSFKTQKDLDKTKAFYDDLAKESAFLFSWTFAKDNILVQINGDLPEDLAKQYEAALNDLR